MAKPYFRQLPNLEYINRKSDGKGISDYDVVKNLFRRAKLNENIFNDLAFFTKYNIKGDERPDNVAYKFYEDSTLDWVVLLSNNIINIQTEWPMPQQNFYNYLIDKYGSESELNSVHHYETVEIIDSDGIRIIPKGLVVPSDYSITYTSGSQTNTLSNVTTAITNYVYEERLQDKKRSIFILKKEYLNIVFNDLEDIMTYEKGGTQYVSPTLKRVENIRLFQ